MEAGDNRPSDAEIIRALAKAYNMPEAVALSWITSMFRHFDPKASTELLAGYGTCGKRIGIDIF